MTMSLKWQAKKLAEDVLKGTLNRSYVSNLLLNLADLLPDDETAIKPVKFELRSAYGLGLYKWTAWESISAAEYQEMKEYIKNNGAHLVEVRELYTTPQLPFMPQSSLKLKTKNPEFMRGSVVQDILEELKRATNKFPMWPTDPLHAIGVVNEEVGELNKALLQEVYEPHKNLMRSDVYTEGLQAAAMLLRFLYSINDYKYEGCQQTRQEWQI